jgi:AcrR family transcriptional regulator
VCSVEGRREPALIDDVTKHAGVSRGSFYKYFNSMDQAVAELGLQMAEEMTAGILSVYDVLEDPVLRTATGFQMFLLRSIIDPQWGSFLAHIALLTPDNLATRKMRDDIRLGIETGDYAVVSIDLAADLLMGAKIEAIRRLILGGGTSSYVQAMAGLVLRSFGVSPAKADKTVTRAYDRIVVEAPGKISWWRPVE